MTDSPNDNLTFEQALAELERVVRELEDGQAGLEDSLARYEAGIGLLKRCYTQLQEAEQRIMRLCGVDAEGRPITQPFEHSATAESPKVESRKRPRKRGEDEQPENLF